MKKIFCLLAFLLFLPFQSVAEQQQCVISYEYWMCYQIGSINKEVIMVVSDIFSLSSDNACFEKKVSKKTKKFVREIKKETNDKFVPSFSPECKDYKNIEEAKEDLQRKIKTAKKRKLRIFHIKFSE